MSPFAELLTAAIHPLTVEKYRVAKGRALSLALAGNCSTPTEAARLFAKLRGLQQLNEAAMSRRARNVRESNPLQFV